MFYCNHNDCRGKKVTAAATLVIEDESDSDYPDDMCIHLCKEHLASWSEEDYSYKIDRMKETLDKYEAKTDKLVEDLKEEFSIPPHLHHRLEEVANRNKAAMAKLLQEAEEMDQASAALVEAAKGELEMLKERERQFEGSLLGDKDL